MLPAVIQPELFRAHDQSSHPAFAHKAAPSVLATLLLATLHVRFGRAGSQEADEHELRAFEMPLIVYNPQRMGAHRE